MSDTPSYPLMIELTSEQRKFIAERLAYVEDVHGRLATAQHVIGKPKTALEEVGPTWNFQRQLVGSVDNFGDVIEPAEGFANRDEAVKLLSRVVGFSGMLASSPFVRKDKDYRNAVEAIQRSIGQQVVKYGIDPHRELGISMKVLNGEDGRSSSRRAIGDGGAAL